MIERLTLRSGKYEWAVSPDGNGAEPNVLYLVVDTRTRNFRMQITAPLPKEDVLNTADAQLVRDIRDALAEAVQVMEAITIP